MEKIYIITPSEIDSTLKSVLDSSENYNYEVEKPEKFSELKEKLDTTLVIFDLPSNEVADLVNQIPKTMPVLVALDGKKTDLDWEDREGDVVYKPYKKEELEIRIANVIKLKILKDEINSLSMTDDLTGLYNRQYLLARLEEELSRSKRYETPITCMIMDIDFFKVVNDMYGYDVGDKVLKQIAVILHKHVRKEDVVTRYGDEEFVVALPATSDRNAYVLAERIRKDIKSFNFFEDDDEPMSVTVSIGISTYPFPHMDPSVNTLIRYAEHSLYNAKKMGKNRSVLFSQINFDI